MNRLRRVAILLAVIFFLVIVQVWIDQTIDYPIIAGWRSWVHEIPVFFVGYAARGMI
jgi:hypothetical protein